MVQVLKLNDKVFETFPELRTDRLLLREIKEQDGNAIFKMRSNGRVNRFIPRPAMEEPQSGKELAVKTAEAFYRREVIGWAGLLRGKGDIIGTCGFNTIDFYNLRAEIGGELDIDYWGKHIALEAVGAIIDFGFRELGLKSIEAKVSPENRGSVHLLEYFGFEKEAHYKNRVYFNGRFSDMAVYTKFAEGFNGEK